MKIIVVNATDAVGGAAIAARRLTEGLRSKGEDAHMLVEKRQGEQQPYIHPVIKNIWEKVKYYRRVKSEEEIVKNLGLNQVYNFTVGQFGVNLSKHKLVREADVIHLHWVNHGFLSLRSIWQILSMGKPVVWTHHDMWPMTGGCHHSRGCMRFTENCGECPVLHSSNPQDISFRILSEKKKKFAAQNLTIITPSSWLGHMENKSALFKNTRCFVIPNSIDTNIFRLHNRGALRDKYNISVHKKVILFGAVNALTNKQKGIDYLIESLQMLAEKSGMKDSITLCIFGESENRTGAEFPVEVKFMGNISSPEIMSELYGLSDAFVLPSLEENLPNTIMEAMSCGIPAVAFNVGGIPDLIEHKKTGYLAEYLSATDFMKGIFYVLNRDENDRLGNESRRKVLLNFSSDAVAQKHIDLYKSLL